MKKIVIILLLSFTVSFSQTDSLNEALKYYPLNIGNFWQYEIGKSELASSNPYSRIGLASFSIIGDTVLQNGEKYFKRISEGIESHFLGHLAAQFLRIDSSKGILFGNNGSGDDFVLDSLLASKNDTVHYFIIRDIAVQNIFDIDTETKICESSITSSYDFYGWNVSKNFGLSSYDYADGNQMEKYRYKLVYAKINGKEYGTFVDVENTNKFPLNFKLMQNYPNPFNPSTIIGYSIPIRGYVQLKVYDILGKKIADLVNKEQSSGNYKVEFNASNLSSGIYFYKLQSGSFVKIKKMLLLQ